MTLKKRHALWALLILLAACGTEPGDDPTDPDAGIVDDAGEDVDPGPTARIALPSNLELSAALNSDATASFTVVNVGDVAVDLSVEATQSWLSLDTESLALDADAQASVSLTASCRELDEVRSGTLTLADVAAGVSAEINVILICGDADPAASLEVAIAGLPDDLTPQVSVTGPDDFEATLTESHIFEDVPPGTYVVEAERVGQGAIYEAAYPTQELEIALGQDLLAVVEYLPVPGSLEVSVAGLPTGAQAALDVIDAEGDVTRLPANAQLDAIEPGDYTLAPADVSAGGTLYSASSQTFSIESEQTTNLTVTYEAGLASLTITIEGTGGAQADVTLSGPNGFSQTLTESTTLNALEPGEYTLSPADIVESPARYQASSSTLTLAAGQQASATVTYEVVRGELQIAADGLGGASFSVRVEGPEGTLNELGPLTLSDLLPGDYLVTFISRALNGETLNASPGSVNVTVTSDGPAAVAQTTYLGTTATLRIALNAPPGAAHNFELRTTTGTTVEAFTLSGSDTRELTLEPGAYILELVNTPTDSGGNQLSVIGAGGTYTLNGGDVVDATITSTSPAYVTSAANSGPGSLRAVIQQVNAGSTITFAPGVSPITLSSRITIDKNITLSGSGQPADLIIRGAGSNGLFDIDRDRRLTVQNLTLRDGFDEYGGVARGEGSMSLVNVDLLNNTAQVNGGALYLTRGSINASNVRAIGNSALNEGGVFWLRGNEPVIVDSHFENNSATELGGAIFANTEFRTDNDGVYLRRNLFKSNSANRGGAVYLDSLGRIQNCTFTENSATERGGALYQDSFLNGIANDDPRLLRLAFNTFSGNTSAQGRSIWKSPISPLELRGNLIVEDSGFALYVPVEDSLQEVVSLGYNIIAPVSTTIIDELATDITSDSALASTGLQTLSDNGGATHTMALSSGAAALGRVPAAQCLNFDNAPLTTDQRRAPRPNAGFCSVGAWESSEAITGTLEDFSTTGLEGSGYESGTFTGTSGLTFVYTEARNQDQYGIDDEGIMLRAGGTLSTTLPAPVNVISIDYRKAFPGTSGRAVEIWVNGQQEATSGTFGTIAGDDPTVYNLTATGLNLTTDAQLEIRVNGAQIVLDNLIWQ
ncbi:hypothetical protein FRC98_19010 [Lujinxingia vulgaris]|uniref:BACON domain-containing protein n=1 Tax=Lujinxingia vulgaris TaxID=2600176 RepID=A0A5C6X8H0_9DELT|nr:choice-of-anchor Q domain-containing protein [Lujinxingia vulgaris]TXD34283.1 hypothetical protein FRC98_19010 [Lujinxingia vulgaris]